CAKRYEKVSDLITSERERKLVHITLEGGQSITATDGHPFRTSEGWRDAVLLKKGAKLLLMGSGEGDDDSAGTATTTATATIEDVRIEVKTTRVYNLEVENLHTFFVGEEGVVVHNAKRSRPSGKERGSDLPTNLKGIKPDPSKTPLQQAHEILGSDCNTGPRSDFNKLKKFLERSKKLTGG
ncbi:Hint domain-containing protein, partial [Acinetobacter sp.]|uniref:Hint domain-containing protein n=1 Tax=Acinetobacter sp. TaxID=472 RepID=UPI0035B300BE